MVFEAPGRPLELRTRPLPVPSGRDVLVEVEACGVCRTDLHVVDGDVACPRLPIVPGHEVVGVVVARGEQARLWPLGARIGASWLAWACGACSFCRSGRENLCGEALFTGLSRDGGYATHMLADERFVVALPSGRDAADMAPWLCAGAIGSRALAFTGDARLVGLFGFGSSAWCVAQLLAHEGRTFVAFTRPGDARAQSRARSLGAAWVGAVHELPPVSLDAAILFAPAGELVPRALELVERGGVVVCAGIHMSDVPSFPYRRLWAERTIRSVANVTRLDVEAFVAKAEKWGLESHVESFPLSSANEVLDRMRRGELHSTAVLVPARDRVRPRRRPTGRPAGEWRASL